MEQNGDMDAAVEYLRKERTSLKLRKKQEELQAEGIVKAVVKTTRLLLL